MSNFFVGCKWKFLCTSDNFVLVYSLSTNKISKHFFIKLRLHRKISLNNNKLLGTINSYNTSLVFRKKTRTFPLLILEIQSRYELILIESISFTSYSRTFLNNCPKNIVRQFFRLTIF
jgi:hypothetical protein